MPVAALKLAVFLLSLLPLVWHGWGAWHDALGANPVEAVTRGLGDWALRFLLMGVRENYSITLRDLTINRE